MTYLSASCRGMHHKLTSWKWRLPWTFKWCYMYTNCRWQNADFQRYWLPSKPSISRHAARWFVAIIPILTIWLKCAGNDAWAQSSCSLQPSSSSSVHDIKTFLFISSVFSPVCHSDVISYPCFAICPSYGLSIVETPLPDQQTFSVIYVPPGK